MKKTLSILIIVSLMLLSSCQIGQMPGKAIAMKTPGYLPIVQCAPAYKGVINFVPSVGECPDYSWTVNDYVVADCGKNQHDADNPAVCQAKDSNQALLGFLKPVVDGKCEEGQVKIIECVARTQYKEKKMGIVKRYTFDNNYPSTEQIGCPDGEKVKDIGCAQDKPTEDTNPVYQCRPQIHLDLGAGKTRWNYFASKSNYCGGWGALGTLGNWYYRIPQKPTVAKPPLSECDQARATNQDLKNKIASIQVEIANLEKQLEAR